jgi:hypothetical protein
LTTREFDVSSIAVREVKDKWVIEDNTMRLEVINANNLSAHAEHMQLVYFPASRTVWQADLVVAGALPGQLPAGFPVVEEFRKILALKNIAADRAIGVHGRVTTPSDWNEMLEKRKSRPSPFFD